jgi:hypothetical protein
LSTRQDEITQKLGVLARITDRLARELGGRATILVVEEEDEPFTQNRLDELGTELKLRSAVRGGVAASPNFRNEVLQTVIRQVEAWDSALQQVGMTCTGMFYPLRQKEVGDARCAALLRELATEGGATTEETQENGRSTVTALMARPGTFSERAEMLEKLKRMRGTRTDHGTGPDAGTMLAGLVALALLAEGTRGAVPVPTLDTVRAAMARGYQPTPDIAQAVNESGSQVNPAPPAGWEYQADCGCFACAAHRSRQGRALGPGRPENGA